MTPFETLQQIIESRRSTKPASMNGKKIADATIRSLLALADWAPTHARNEPWRFVVYSGEALVQFGIDHAELYKANTPDEQFTTAKYEALKHNGDKVSHIIAVYMKRVEGAKIPVIEDIAATAAATQHILLGAEALGIAVLWSTGGMTHHPAMKQYLGLNDDDHMLGLLYLGYLDEAAPQGKRSVPLESKVTWKS